MHKTKMKLLILGAGGLGRTVLEHACLDYECFFIDDAFSPGTIICNVPVVGNIDSIKTLYPKYEAAIVAIGDNKLREQITKMLKELGYTIPNIICRSAYISPFATIGEGCIVLNNACIQNGSNIGDGVVINANVEIHHDSCVNDFALIYTNSTVRTNALVGARAKIGSNVTICNNVQINEDVIIEDGMRANY